MTKLLAHVVIRTDGGQILRSSTVPLDAAPSTPEGAYESALRVAQEVEAGLQHLTVHGLIGAPTDKPGRPPRHREARA